jgi:hypothetical protein
MAMFCTVANSLSSSSLTAAVAWYNGQFHSCVELTEG